MRIFYRYRTMHAHGYAKWVFRDTIVADKDAERDWEEQKEEIVEDIKDRWSWSEKFRRVEIERVERPPIEFLLREIEASKRISSNYAKRQVELEELAKTYESWEEPNG